MQKSGSSSGSVGPKLVVRQVVLEVLLPPCHPFSRTRIVQQLTKRQLKQFQSDTLTVFVLSNPPRLALIAMNRSQDKVYLFADDYHVADACARQFYEDALGRLQTLEPSSLNLQSGNAAGAGGQKVIPYKIVSIVAKCNVSTANTMVTLAVDLLELESRVMAKSDPLTLAIFDPEEYPGLVWLDLAAGTESLEAAHKGNFDIDPFNTSETEYDMKTIVFPSGAIVVHGPSLEKMEEAMKKKFPVIIKCMKDIPGGVVHRKSYAE